MLRHSPLTERRITSDVGGSSDGAGGDSNLAAARGGRANRVSGPDRVREAEAPPHRPLVTTVLGEFGLSGIELLDSIGRERR